MPASLLLPAFALGVGLLLVFGGMPAAAVLPSQLALGGLALLSIGRPLVFTALLAGLMVSLGGWHVLKLSIADVRFRSYFGVYSVGQNRAGNAVTLTHGTTLHGAQNLPPHDVVEPTTYYVRNSGVGRSLAAAPDLFGPRARIGVVGLGTGTVSCYARPGQQWHFYEIDRAMARLATDSGYFTFLRNCAPDARIVLGDARLSLARSPTASLDLLVLDAFSSDAIPVHLLTGEAFDLYGRVLQPEGVLLVHISNRYLDLEPVVAAAAAAGGWEALMLSYRPGEKAPLNATSSVWVVLSRSPDSIDAIVAARGAFAMWKVLSPKRGFAGWTDDYASILPLIDFD
jgi:hypothetical protein